MPQLDHSIAHNNNKRARDRSLIEPPLSAHHHHTISKKKKNKKQHADKQEDLAMASADAKIAIPLPMPVVDATINNSHSSSLAGGTFSKHKPVIILLDQASLETVRNKRGVYELLNCDDHRNLCKNKLHIDPNQYRPDILHQELLALFDSPLHKAGLLKVYILTQKQVLIDVHSSARIPRTYARFAGLMVQLLHKMKIKAGTESTVLFKVIKNPFAQYLPAGTRVYGMEPEGQLYSPVCLARHVLPSKEALLQASTQSQSSQQSSQPSTLRSTCFIVGATSSENVQLQDHPYLQEMISISEYPLSGAAALSRLLYGMEEHWGIV